MIKAITTGNTLRQPSASRHSDATACSDAFLALHLHLLPPIRTRPCMQMMVKMTTLGVQMFAPMTVVSLVLLFPIHISGSYLEDGGTDGNPSQFMRLTLTNVSKGADVMWWVA